MNRSNGRTPGFSRLEVAFILVLIALVGVLTITQYLDLSRTAKQSVDSRVAALRGGISDYALESRDRGRLPIYPPRLEDAEAGLVRSRNRFFTHVIEHGLAINGCADGTNPLSYTQRGHLCLCSGIR